MLVATAGLSVSCSLIYNDALDELADEPTTTTSSGGGGGATSTTSGAGAGSSTSGTGTGGTGGAGVGGSGGNGGTGAGPPPTECKGGDGACLGAIPAGWDGYYSNHTTPVGGGLATCPVTGSPRDFQLYSQPSTATAQCSACNCTAPAILCNAPFSGFQNNGCSGGATGLSLGSGCTSTGSSVNGVVTQQATTSSANCTASGGATQIPDPAWGAEHSLCKAGLFAGGCSDMEECVDEVGVQLCIMTNGDAPACPAGWETASRIVTYVSGSDNRGCSGCSCVPPAGNLCLGGTYQFFGSAGCLGGAIYSVPEGSLCTDTTNSVSGMFVPPSNGAMCSPSGGAPTGSVVPEQPVTLCCR
jgi:hypothetical protein